jgi:hypothetical protein
MKSEWDDRDKTFLRMNNLDSPGKLREDESKGCEDCKGQAAWLVISIFRR